ncbi:hypothetical protein SCP_0703020 [Sparassis crispa]|uniref:Uncharacterized protein n=1 Tax=Sparassis crispa TaxID=139825 RepID=A0A401GSC7_9APHY|nr:hypothetical protein SCP_0703020 [Sparassis crispa]GBE85116.1 hypothetical protein SCP_0703020 [Sparassis crispa]
MAQQVATYPRDIPTLLDKHPGIPIHFVHTLHLDEPIAAGTPVDSNNARVAEAAAQSLTALQYDPVITEDIVETAVNRSKIIRSMHAEIQFDHGIGAVLALLQAMDAKVDGLRAQVEQTNTKVEQTNTRVEQTNTRVAQLTTRVAQLTTRVEQLDATVKTSNQRMDKLEAAADNTNITRRNKMLRRAAEPFLWRKKQISGSGSAHFERINGGREGVVDRDIQELGGAALGGTFTNPPSPYRATQRELYRLMIFYNEDFGIVAEDALDVRRDKLLLWLSDN